ncbi:MAG: acyclic terpene utilization AtuA family protein [Comamonas sp.]
MTTSHSDAPSPRWPVGPAPSTPRGALLVGCGAGFSGDRTDAARPVVDALMAAPEPAVLIFETLAERTLALAQLARERDPAAGYEPLLADLLRPVLADCLAHGIRIVSNFGAANPAGAAACIAALAEELGLRVPRMALVHGDDLMGPEHAQTLQDACGADWPAARVVSANAYIGAQPIAQALLEGAEIVIAGRVADPALVLGPAAAWHGWAWDDWDLLARGTMAGHLLECGSQVSGGYFADPGYKDVPDLAHVGFPIARIESDGRCTIGKPANTGGLINAQTVKEQLLYEVHDPSAYLTPDVVADISQATVTEVGPNQVRLEGVRGHARPTELKVNVCSERGWLAEAEISYAGAHALARAQLARQVIVTRLAGQGKLRCDFIGVTSVLGDDRSQWLDQLPAAAHATRDVRVRWAWEQPTARAAEVLLREVNALYTCGPGGGGGVRTQLRSRLSTVSCLIAQDLVECGWRWWRAAGERA